MAENKIVFHIIKVSAFALMLVSIQNEQLFWKEAGNIGFR